MQHLIAWSESLAGSGFTFVNVAACVDPTIHASGDYNYIPKGLNKVIWGAGRGDNMTGFKLNSPSLRAMFAAGMGPVDNLSSNQTSRELNANYIGENPLPLVESEGVEALIVKPSGGAAIMGAAICLSDGPVISVGGAIFSIDFSTTITTVTGQWVSGAITFAETLPAGRYQIVGSLLWTLNGLFYRFIIPGSGWRPGGVCLHDTQTRTPPWMRNGRCGVLGEFDHDVPPSMELLADSAESQGVGGCLDLIKIA